MNERSLSKGRLFAVASALAVTGCLHTDATLRYEYWIDSATEKRVEGALGADGGSVGINLADTDPGFHILSFRVSDDGGQWSTPRGVHLISPYQTPRGEASAYEYWFDCQSRARVSGTLSGGNSLALDISASELSPGLHTLMTRVGDGNGNWSPVSASLFLRPFGKEDAEAAECEYWIDGDTKERRRVALAGGAAVVDIDASRLSPGVHGITFRAIDADGKAGAISSSFFIKPHLSGQGAREVTAYRWWLDDGPEMTTVEIDAAPMPYEGVIPMDARPKRLTRENMVVLAAEGDMLRFGARTVLNLAFRDGVGSWGTASADTFAVSIPAAMTDLTEFIENHDATKGNQGWKWEGSIGKLIQDDSHWTGEKRPYFCMGNTSDNGFTTTMTQTIDGLPAGVYLLSAYGRANTAVTMRMSVGENYVEFPAEGSEGEGGGWNRRSIAFATDGTPFEIKVEGTTEERGQWFDISDFTLTLNCVGSLTVEFPDDTDMSLYRNMSLSLEGGGRRMTRVVSESASGYAFDGISPSTDYTLRLLNSYGQTVASMDDISIGDGASMTLSGFRPLVDPTISVTSPDGKTVEASVEWCDLSGRLFARGDSLHRVPEGERMLCHISLGERDGIYYREPQPMEVMADRGNTLTEIVLEPVAHREIPGEIYGDGSPLAGASVSVTEYVNRKYPNTIRTRTGNDGIYKVSISADSCRVDVMADGFIDHSETMNVSDALGRIDMKRMNGAVVSLSVRYCESSKNGPVESNISVGLQDMAVIARNVTEGHDSIETSRQNGRLVLPGVHAGEKVELTLTSPSGVFSPATATVLIEDDLTGRCEVSLVQPGSVEARYESSQNRTDAVILFNAYGDKVASGEYTAQAVTLSGLAAGVYTLVSLNGELARSNIPTLDALTASGWTEGSDYLSTPVNVADGYVAEVSVGSIPRGTARVRHVGEKSSFSSKKTTVTAGKFLTLTAIVEFNTEYADEVSGMSLVVDLPDGVEYIANSAMVGNHVNEARVTDGRLVVPVEDSEIGEQIKFCVTPLVAGKIVIPSALEFSLGGESVSEPLGSAGIEVENLKMTVPEILVSDRFKVTGLAPALSEILVTDGGVIIGGATAKADGSWMAECVLANPFHLTEHAIMAKVTDPSGRKFVTDVYQAQCDITDNEVQKVVMVNTAHNSQSLNTCEYVTEFNFKDPAVESPVYWYWPNYPTFTYKVVYADNSPDRVKNSEVDVRLTDGNTRKVKTVYDPASDSWVGSTDFPDAASLPANVTVKTENRYDTDSGITAEVMSSVYAGILMQDKKYNPGEGNVWITEADDGSFVRFESEKNGQTSGATMRFSEVDAVPDPSTDGPDVIRMETKVDDAEPITILFDEVSDKIMIYSPFSMFEKISEPLDGVIGQYNEIKENTSGIVEEAERLNDNLKKKGIQLTELDSFLEYLDFLDEMMDKAAGMNQDFKNYLDLIRRYERLRGCEFVPDSYINSRIKDLKRSFNIYFSVQGACAFGEWAAGKINFLPLKGAVQITTKSGILASCAGKWISKKAASNDLMAFEQACGLSDGKDRNSGCPDAQHVIDPSGYVYEAVTSNRLPGVTATVYELKKEEDMYGEIHETPEVWDASAYSQRNPVVTDDNGVYAWDVPQGEWQVRFEKDGYEPASTGWLPVPPSQLEINVGMTHAVAPDAVGARAYESGVVVAFDKYMEPGSFTPGSILVSVDGKDAEGRIVAENLETDAYTGRSYASEMRLAVKKALVVGDSVDVVVGGSPRSYATMEMVGERRFRVPVLPEITSIVADSVMLMAAGTTTLIPVSVSPATSANGKWLRVHSASPSIIVPSAKRFRIDESGVALVEVRSLLPGSGVLRFSIDDYDLEAMTRVDAEAVDESRVTMPTSSVTSGSAVAPGTEIELATATPEAKIWYTLDGTCPCLEGSRMPYTGPIAVTEDVVVKAQAFRDGLAPSEIAVFHYIVDNSGIDDAASSRIRVMVDGGTVVVEAPEGSSYEVYDTDGMTMASGKTASGRERLRMTKGYVYFVHAVSPDGGHRTVKVII